MRTALLIAPLVLAACAAVEPASADSASPCGADKAAAFVGRPATAAVRVEVVRAVGHDRVRWLAPDTVVTMDFSEARLNADLDGSGKITRFRCG